MGIPKVTSEEVLYLRLKQDIRTGALPPGSRLLEAELCKVYGVSRAVVRTALRRLEAEGLTRIDPYKGARIPMLSVDEIADVLYVREVLDGLAARLAAERVTDEGMRELREVLDRMDRAFEAIDLLEWSDLDSELHLLIAQIAENLKLQEIVESIRTMTVRYILASILTAHRVEESQIEHRKILDAIAARRPEQAEEAAREHVASVRNNLVKRASERFPLLP